MEDYKEMYLNLFNNITEIIEELKKVQAETEEMYVNAQDNKADEE